MKIIIVDDHVLFREGLEAILRQEPDIDVVDSVGTVLEAISSVRRLKPDIVLMDFNLPDGTGADAARSIMQDHPKCKILFLTMTDDDDTLFAAVRSGAIGFMLKNISMANLIINLRSVQAGESALSRSMTLRLMSEFSRTRAPDKTNYPALAKLTHRERDVLVEIIAGKSNKEIGKSLFISENTVKYHVHSMLEKFNLSERKELAKFAKENGIK